MRIVIAGHVDHGKSTLIGRLLKDTGSLPDGKIEELEKICARRGSDIEWSFLLDTFQAERDQAVTIDIAQVPFKTAKRSYVLIDAPGHEEFIRNMISGAAQAEVAIVVIDADEGVREQTRRHIEVLSILGVRQIIVVVNKMDLVGYRQSVFEKISEKIKETAQFIPLAARNGEMIAGRGENMGWYEGLTLVETLDTLEVVEKDDEAALRFSVQDIYRMDGKRIIAGRVEAGVLRQGDEIIFSPYNQTAKIETIEVWPKGKTEAHAGDCVGITLDSRIFVERGHVGSREEAAPVLSPVFRARIFQFADIRAGQHLNAQIGTQDISVQVQSVEGPTDLTLRARGLLPLDTGARIVLSNAGQILGIGRIDVDGFPDQRRVLQTKPRNVQLSRSLLTFEERAERNGHKGAVFWMTGLSGAGKTTIAMAVEKALFDRGQQVCVLDGDNVRHGLNADLGFSPDDRAENIRRVGQAAALMAESGLIVIAAFISPYRSDRERAKVAAQGRFHEIHIHADLEVCELRDPKGLYKQARDGKISGFTGIDSPYEAPDYPDLVIDTQENDVEHCVDKVLEFIEQQVALPQTMSGKEKIFVI